MIQNVDLQVRLANETCNRLFESLSDLDLQLENARKEISNLQASVRQIMSHLSDIMIELPLAPTVMPVTGAMPTDRKARREAIETGISQNMLPGSESEVIACCVVAILEFYNCPVTLNQMIELIESKYSFLLTRVEENKKEFIKKLIQKYIEAGLIRYAKFMNAIGEVWVCLSQWIDDSGNLKPGLNSTNPESFTII